MAHQQMWALGSRSSGTSPTLSPTLSNSRPGPSIGLVVNPRSGNDVRRVVASAGTSTLDDKISIVRRIVRGAIANGVTHFVTNREPHRIVRRATETMAGVRVDHAVAEIDNTEADSTAAARAMRDRGCAVVVVLGGDGTNRAVCKGWPDAPLIPLSTGTNNAFPVWCEPTVAGLAAALVARGSVEVDDVSVRAKLVHVTIDPGSGDSGSGDSGSGEPDVALIDAAAVADPFVGSLELFDPATMRVLLLTRADPAAIGFSAVGGLLHPVSAADDAGLYVALCHPSGAAHHVRAATAPGHVADVGVDHFRVIGLDEPVTIAGPTILAFDGERKRRLLDGDRAMLTIRRDGPRVIDVGLVMRHNGRIHRGGDARGSS
jgi:hypothetical protein